MISIFSVMVFALINALLITSIFAFLFIKSRNIFLLFWTTGWLFYFLRILFEFLLTFYPEANLLSTLSNILFFASGAVILTGTFAFLYEKRILVFSSILAILFLFVFISALKDKSIYYAAFPLVFGAALIFKGIIVFIKSKSIIINLKPFGLIAIIWGGNSVLFAFLKSALISNFLDFILLFLAAMALLFEYSKSISNQTKFLDSYFKNLIDNAHDLIYRYSFYPERKFEYVSPSSLRITGYSPEEHYSDPELGLKLIYPDDKPLLMKIFSGNIDSISEPVNLRWTHKSGKIFWIEQRNIPILDSNGNLLAIEGIAREITEQIENKIKLEESESRHKLLSEVSLEAIVIYNKNKIIDVNNIALKNFEYELLEKEGPSIFNKIIVLEDNSTPKDFPHNPSSAPIRAKIKKANGSLIPVEIQITGTHYKSSPAYAMIIRDISERIIMENELVRAKEEAEKSEKLKSEFLSQISHEIRTPVNIIFSYTTLLESELKDKIDAELKEGLDYVKDACLRLIRTIDMLIYLSELQTGNYIPKKVGFDLYGEVLSKLFFDYKKRAERKNIEISINNKASNNLVFCDKHATSIICENIIDNAIKFTPKGTVKINLINEKNNLKLEVLDTGVGIADDQLKRLFSPFMQEEQGYTRSFDGNGIGLALVKKYCDVNNIAIKAESKKQSGSKFCLSFPAFSPKNL